MFAKIACMAVAAGAYFLINHFCNKPEPCQITSNYSNTYYEVMKRAPVPKGPAPKAPAPRLLHLNESPSNKKLITPCDELLQFFNLNLYEPSPEMRMLTKKKFIESNDMTVKARNLLAVIMNYTTFDGNLLNKLNYTKMLTLFIEMEYAAAEIEMYRSDQYDKKIQFIRGDKYSLHLPELLDEKVSIAKNDQLWLVPMAVYNTNNSQKIKNHQITATVKCIEGANMYIQIKKSDNINLPICTTNILYYIHFNSNGAVYKFERNAVNIIDKYNLSAYLFPKIPQMIPTKLYYKFNWFNKNIIDNPIQQQAIKNIVNGTSFPAPYLLFGPPGTGKTSTLVETICQLCSLQPSCKLLVCASSNASCNEIGMRLLKFLPENVLFRIFSASYNIENVTDVLLLQSSNYETIRIMKQGMKKEMKQYNYSYKDPSLNVIYDKSIILCTLALAGKLVLKHKRLNHFTHVFIDECASSTESQSLLAIAGICNDGRQMLRNIVLIGDPKQLGPVLMSKMAVKLGYDCSMMERLMDRQLYKRDPITNKYNANVITKLLYNFRSHSALLKLSNEFFYDNELIVKGNIDITNWCLGWENLPSKQFPIIFNFTNGEMFIEDGTSSSYNNFEIERVMYYLKNILLNGINGRKVNESDIGIISPYKSQRFNVALTRAQALLIIIGNPKTLQHDEYWHKLIEYCIENKAVSGYSFKLKKFTHNETTEITETTQSPLPTTNLAIQSNEIDPLITRLAAI